MATTNQAPSEVFTLEPSMGRKRSPSSPKPSDYVALEEAGQQVFGAIPVRPEAMRHGRKRASPLLNTGNIAHRLTEDVEAGAADATGSTIDPPSTKEPSLPFRPSELNIQHLTPRQITYILVSCIISILIMAIVVFRADVTEVGTSAFKITGLFREVVLGFAGICALPFTALTISASMTLSRAAVWWVSYLLPRRLISFPITLLVVLSLQIPSAISILFTHKHMWFVSKSIYQSVVNVFTMPSDWTPIVPPPPLPLRKPNRSSG